METNEDKFWRLIKQLKEIQIEAVECVKSDQDEQSRRKKQKQLIGAQIRTYRVENRLTQEELATRLNVTKMEIIRWELARNMPSKVFMEILKEKGIVRGEDL